MENEILNLIDRYWKFDNDQEPVSNWHDKQDLLEAVRKALRINDVSVAKRKLCPTCGSDSLITLSDITYCMNDCCDGVKGHN